MAAIPWTTAVVEQGHGSTATVAKAHSGLTHQVTALRGFLHLCRSLFERQARPSEDPSLLPVEGPRKQLARITGRHMYLAELFEAVQQAQGDGVSLSREVRQALMKEHSHLYSKLEPQEQARYSQAAQAVAHLRQEAASSAREEMLQDLAARAVAMQPERIDGISHLLLTNSSFSSKDLEEMSIMLDSPAFQGTALATRRAQTSAPLQMPPPYYQQLMNNIPVPAVATTEAPAWAKIVCCIVIALPIAFCTSALERRSSRPSSSMP